MTHSSRLKRLHVPRRGVAVVAAVTVAVFSWFASSTAPFTWPTRLMTGAAGAGMLCYARWFSRREPGRGRRWWRSVRGERGAHALRPAALAWLGLPLALLLAEAALVLFTSNRSSFPTISSLMDPLLHQRLARFVAYGAWLLFGAWLARL